MQREEEQKVLNVAMALTKYGDMIRRVCFLYVRKREDVEDVFQDVFLKYIERKEPFASEEHEKAWLLRVAINGCKNLLMSFWHNRISPLEDEILAIVPAESKYILQEVLKLPYHERTCIYLFYYEGYSVPEIATIQHQKPNTVYSHIHRGRKRLKKVLGGIENEENDADSI
jgi:RNA polymerase sigma factor (sigma-70 family)